MSGSEDTVSPQISQDSMVEQVTRKEYNVIYGPNPVQLVFFFKLFILLEYSYLTMFVIVSGEQ